MRRYLAFIAATAMVLFGLGAYAPAFVAGAQEATPDATAGTVEVTLQDVDGQAAGTATFQEVAEGVRVQVALENVAAGEHGLHAHQVGLCEPGGDEPFSSAGPHFNPTDAPHGAPPTTDELATPPAEDHVAHAGDLGNITVGEDGTGTADVVTNRFTLSDGPASLAGEYGSALVLHENADDLTTQPSGDSGPRIACGVIVATEAGTPVPAEESAAAPAAEPVEIQLVDIAFNPKKITIPADTDVTIVLPNNGAAAHNFVIDALDIHSGDVAPGTTVEVVINAPAGEYEFYCSIPGHKAAGMWGTLTVE